MKKISKRDITILAIDFLNEKRFEVLSSLPKELKSLEGVKVINRDGNESKKFTLKSIHDEMILNDIYYTFSAWYDLDNYVKLRTRVRINGGSHSDNSAFTEYFDDFDSIGRIDNNILTLVDLHLEASIIGVEEEIKNKMTKEKFDVYKDHYEIAKNTIEEITSKIPRHFRDIITY